MHWTTLLATLCAVGIGLLALGSVYGLAGAITSGTSTVASLLVVGVVAIAVAAATAVGVTDSRFLERANYW